MIKIYYQLTKPGIIYGNALTLVAGFFLASKGHLSFGLFLAALVGLSLIIASSCVFNNVMDAEIDAKMDRTKTRAMVVKVISKTNAIIFATLLGTAGVVALYFFTNYLTLAIALSGMFFYLALYTPLKRRTVYGTLIGAVSGAAPPVVGYTAVSNRFDVGALILFLILMFWQMPHFYAIAIRRLNEYRAAGIPVLPLKKGIRLTKIHMLVYIIAFTLAAASLTYFKYTGYVYLAVAMGFGFAWLFKGIQGFKIADDKAWAKKMFLFSLMVLTSLCVIIPVDILIKNHL